MQVKYDKVSGKSSLEIPENARDLFSRSFFENMGFVVEEEEEEGGDEEEEGGGRSKVVLSLKRSPTASSTSPRPLNHGGKTLAWIMASKEKKQHDVEEGRSGAPGGSGDMRQKEYLYRTCERDERSGLTYLEKERVVMDIKMQEDLWNTLHGYEMKDEYRPEEIYVVGGRYMYLGTSPTRRPLGQMQSDDSIRRLISLLDGAKHTGTLLWKMGGGARKKPGVSSFFSSSFSSFFSSDEHADGETVKKEQEQEEDGKEENEMDVFAEHESSRKEVVDDRQQDRRQEEEEEESQKNG